MKLERAIKVVKKNIFEENKKFRNNINKKYQETIFDEIFQQDLK